MSITDELREWWVRKFPVMDKELHEDFTAIADRIDAEHQKCIDAMWEDAKSHLSDESLTEHGWIRLPKDADGEYINIHDCVEVDDGKRVRVDAIAPNAVYWWEGDGCHWCQSFMLSHYHAPTVEDVLRKFADEMNQNLGMYTSEAIDADEWRSADNKTIVEYAKRLTLAEGEDA